MDIREQVYINATEEPITYVLGTTAGSRPIRHTVEPGEEFEGPVNYQKFFARHKLVVANDKTRAEGARVAKAYEKRKKSSSTG